MAVSCLFPGQGGSPGGPGGSRSQGEARLPQKPPKTQGKLMKSIPKGFPVRKVSQRLSRALFKKAIRGGKFNIKIMRFLFFGGDGFRGNWGAKAIKRH